VTLFEPLQTLSVLKIVMWFGFVSSELNEIVYSAVVLWHIVLLETV
jgi:hypothetical protein